MSCVAADQASSYFLYNGEYLTFADWRFVHRARLGQLLLNGCRPWDNTDSSKACRFCSSGQNETTGHVLHNCLPHMPAFTNRHNAVLKRVLDAIRSSSWNIHSVDAPLPPSNYRPDVVVSKGQTAIIIDVTVVHERGLDSFQRARDLKKSHYETTASSLQSRFKNVLVDAIVVGGCGTWDPNNDKILRKFCSRKYLSLFKRLTVADTISWGRRIYNEHISGQRHYTVEDNVIIPRFSPYSDALNPYSSTRSHSTSSAFTPRRMRGRRSSRQRRTRYPFSANRYPTYSPIVTEISAPSSEGHGILKPSSPGSSSTKSVTFSETVHVRIFEESPASPISTFLQCSQNACVDQRRVVETASDISSDPSSTLSRITVTATQSLVISAYHPLPERLRGDPAIVQRLMNMSD